MKQIAPEPSTKNRRFPAGMSLLGLCAAIFFMVSGGPYGLEEILASHGYGRALLLLCVVPLLWSLPIALMVGELASAIPAEGGYYVWVRRALSPFWGFQQAWLALLMSLVDMAIYPTLFCTYLGQFWPALAEMSPGQPGWWLGLLLIAGCAAWNLRGSRSVGGGSVVLGAVLLSPFVVLLICMLVQGRVGLVQQQVTQAPPEGGAWLAGVLLCLWNYMGWDSASTIAGEVENPQRTYPKALLLTLGLVTMFYVLSVLCAAASGLPAASFTTGSWVAVATQMGGKGLAALVVLGGALCGLGMCSALMLSYSRLPVSLAEDGFLPRIVARRRDATGAPAVAIVGMAVLYAGCLGLGLRKLVQLDVVLYGATLLLQFVSLLVLRIKEPGLTRPFRVPFGLVGTALCGIPPLSLLGYALYAGRNEPGSPVTVALIAAVLGSVVYLSRTSQGFVLVLKRAFFVLFLFALLLIGACRDLEEGPYLPGQNQDFGVVPDAMEADLRPQGPPAPDDLVDPLEIHYINVGWGSSLLVRGPDGMVVLIEGGNQGAGAAHVVPYLQKIGVLPKNGLDYTIAGHQHCDHVGGLDEVILSGYDVQLANFYNGSSYKTSCVTEWHQAAAKTSAGAPVVPTVGQQIALGRGAHLTFVAVNGEILGGKKVAVSDENDRSIAVLIQYGGFDFLWASDLGGGNTDSACTGRYTSQVDVETSVIEAISEGAMPLISKGGIDVLHINHHGSESSTNSNWVNGAAPTLAVISVGGGQAASWNLPRIDVVEKVLLGRAVDCVKTPPQLVLQTEEGSPLGPLTSTAAFSVGDIRIATEGKGRFHVSATGRVEKGQNEALLAGLPRNFPLDE